MAKYPAPNGVQSTGTSSERARLDHVHPSDPSKVDKKDLARVALTGSYNDLTDKPEEPEEPEYEVIDFIESDGASYINTGILPTADLKAVVKVSHASLDSITSAARQYALGTYSRDGENTVVGRYQFYYSGYEQSGATFFGWGSGGSTVGFKYISTSYINPDTAEHTAVIDNGEFLFDDVGLCMLENPVFTVQKPIYLFALNENGTANWFSNGLRIESVEFSRNGVTVANFVPRMRTADGELGMLETVSNVFYTNDGTGHFSNDTIPSEHPYMVVVRPEQFGAKGDGVTDDTIAIQAAFDAASNNGTVIFGRKKTYLVSKANGGEAYVIAPGTATQKIPYMLKIPGSMTILGNGSTIKRTAITQSEYDNQSTNPTYATMFLLGNSERNQSERNAEISDRNYVIIRGLTLDGGMSSSVKRTLANAGWAGGIGKAIYLQGAQAPYLELESVTVKEFPAEGVFMGQDDPGAKIKAFGCTFQNCTPSSWNLSGTYVEATGCTFNQTEYGCQATEYAAQKNVFDNCTFNSTNGWIVVAMGQGTSSSTPSGGLEDLDCVVKNCVFNIDGDYVIPDYEQAKIDQGDTTIPRNHDFPIINTFYSENVVVEGCIFHDDRTSNYQEPVVDANTFDRGIVQGCLFERSSLANGDTFYTNKMLHASNNCLVVRSFSNGSIIRGRGLTIKLVDLGMSEYSFSQISRPISIMVAATSDVVLESYGFGNKIVTVNENIYAYAPNKIYIDYSQIGNLAYDSTNDTFQNFFVRCSGNFNLTIET